MGKKIIKRGGWVGGKAILRLQTSQEERERENCKPDECLNNSFYSPDNRFSKLYNTLFFCYNIVLSTYPILASCRLVLDFSICSFWLGCPLFWL